MAFWWWDRTPQNVIFWLESSIANLKGCSENPPFYAWYIFILIPNLEAHLSKDDISDKISHWFVILIRCTYIKSLKWYTITLAAQILTLMSLPDTCGTNTVWYESSCSTEISYPILFSVYFLVYLDLLPFVIHWLIVSV